jgi:hypothetical protein
MMGFSPLSRASAHPTGSNRSLDCARYAEQGVVAVEGGG